MSPEIETILGIIGVLLFIAAIIWSLSRDCPPAVEVEAEPLPETTPTYKEEAQTYHDDVLVPRYDKLLKAAKRKHQRRLKVNKQKQENPPLDELKKIVSIIDTEHGKLIRCGKDAVHTKHIVSIKSCAGGNPRLYEGRLGNGPSWADEISDIYKSFQEIKASSFGRTYTRYYGTHYNPPQVCEGYEAQITIESVSGKEFSIALPQYLADHAFDTLMKAWKGSSS